uniref:Putative secreted protein n=1 Tax=Ixodes ricinus TaxID=34613 RepID=A0A6B0U8R6_IXORI
MISWKSFVASVLSSSRAWQTSWLRTAPPPASPGTRAAPGGRCGGPARTGRGSRGRCAPPGPAPAASRAGSPPPAPPSTPAPAGAGPACGHKGP